MSLAIILAALAAARADLASGELARVNETVITLEEFERRYAENARFFSGKPPGRKAVLEDMIKRELGVQEARRLGVDKEPRVVERINSVVFQALLERSLNKETEAIHVADEEAKSYYDKNPDLRTSHIFVPVPPNGDPKADQAALERITKIRETLLKPGKMSFAEIAQRESEGIAAPMGGDLDFQSKDKLDPAYYAAALKLRSPGRVSDIVRSAFGYHIIRLTAVRPWEDVDKAAVKRAVFEQKRNQVYEKYMGALRAKAKVSSHPEMLKD